MGEGDGCDGWVLKEPINARSGEFKTPKSALPRPVRDRSLFCADGERWLRRGAGVGWRLGCRARRAAAGLALRGRPSPSTVASPWGSRAAASSTPPLPAAPMAQFVFESDLHSLLQLDAPIPNAPPARWQRKAKEAAGPAPSPMRAANRSHSAGRTPGRTPGEAGAAGRGRERKGLR